MVATGAARAAAARGGGVATGAVARAAGSASAPCQGSRAVERAAAVTAVGKVAEGLAVAEGLVAVGKVAEGLVEGLAVRMGGRGGRDCHPRQRDIFAPRVAAAPPASASKCAAVTPLLPR